MNNLFHRKGLPALKFSFTAKVDETLFVEVKKDC